jgi:hypothetical protein
MALGRKTGGREKGTPNKLTKSAKEAFQLAFDQLGGWERLAKWATEDPDNLKAFYNLYARLIPTDVTSGGNAIPAPIIRLAHGGPEREAD